MDIQHKKAILARFSKDMFPLTKSLAWFCRFMLKNKESHKGIQSYEAYSKKKVYKYNSDSREECVPLLINNKADYSDKSSS